MELKVFVNALVEKLKSLPDGHNPEQEAWWMLEAITGKTHTELLLKKFITLSDEQEQKLNHFIKQRVIERKPLQYILGFVPFLNLTIKIRPPILIPRPETEHLTDWMIGQLKGKELSILDLCTGSGCIALSLAKALPLSNVIGSDLFDEAIELASENQNLNGVDNCTFIKSDLYENIDQKFDIIVSNPPYGPDSEWDILEPEIRNWESKHAFIGGESGLEFYKKIVSMAPSYLNNNSVVPKLVLEIGDTQAKEVSDMIRKIGMEAKIHKDLAGKDRFVTAWL